MYAKRSHFKIDDTLKVSNEEKEVAPKEEPVQKMMDIGDENICLICYEHPPDAVFMECGHGGTLN
jgi:hypothetical protein